MQIGNNNIAFTIEQDRATLESDPSGFVGFVLKQAVLFPRGKNAVCFFESVSGKTKAINSSRPQLVKPPLD